MRNAQPPDPIPDDAVIPESSTGRHRPNPMPTTPPPGFAIPERTPKLGPLATFKRLLLNLYGNGKRP